MQSAVPRQTSILDPKLNTVLRRVLPKEVYERILYYEVCILTEGTKKAYVTAVVTNTDIYVYPQRVELRSELLMRIPWPVVRSIEKLVDPPPWLQPDVALVTQHIQIQYRTKRDEGAVDFFTFQQQSRLFFHLQRVWCHSLAAHVMKRSLSGRSCSAAEAADQINHLERALREAATLERKIELVTALTALINRSTAASAEFFRTGLYPFLLDELFALVPAVRFPRTAASDEHLSDLAGSAPVGATDPSTRAAFDRELQAFGLGMGEELSTRSDPSSPEGSGRSRSATPSPVSRMNDADDDTDRSLSEAPSSVAAAPGAGAPSVPGGTAPSPGVPSSSRLLAPPPSHSRAGRPRVRYADDAGAAAEDGSVALAGSGPRRQSLASSMRKGSLGAGGPAAPAAGAAGSGGGGGGGGGGGSPATLSASKSDGALLAGGSGGTGGGNSSSSPGGGGISVSVPSGGAHSSSALRLRMRRTSTLDRVAQRAVRSSLAALKVTPVESPVEKAERLEYVIAVLELLHVSLALAPCQAHRLGILRMRKPHTFLRFLNLLLVDYLEKHKPARPEGSDSLPGSAAVTPTLTGSFSRLADPLMIPAGGTAALHRSSLEFGTPVGSRAGLVPVPAMQLPDSFRSGGAVALSAGAVSGVTGSSLLPGGTRAGASSPVFDLTDDESSQTSPPPPALKRERSLTLPMDPAADTVSVPSSSLVRPRSMTGRHTPRPAESVSVSVFETGFSNATDAAIIVRARSSSTASPMVTPLRAPATPPALPAAAFALDLQPQSLLRMSLKAGVAVAAAAVSGSDLPGGGASGSGSVPGTPMAGARSAGVSGTFGRALAPALASSGRSGSAGELSSFRSDGLSSLPSEVEDFFREQRAVIDEIVVAILFVLEEIAEQAELEPLPPYSVEYLADLLARSPSFVSRKLPALLQRMKELVADPPSPHRTVTLFEHVSVLDMLVSYSAAMREHVGRTFSATFRYFFTEEKMRPAPPPQGHMLDTLSAQRLAHVRSLCFP